MKKCPSCAKDLPDAALHCVFCGAKQAPAPAGAGGVQAKTVMGWQASDVLAGLPPRPGTPAAPPPGPPAAPPPGIGHAATLAVSATPGPVLGNAATMMATAESLGVRPPQAAPQPAGPPPGPPAPASGAATMFQQSPFAAIPTAASPPPAAMAPPQQPAGAKTMFVPQPATPPPAANQPPVAESGASTMFQQSPFAGGANPNLTPQGGPPPGAPAQGMGGPPPGYQQPGMGGPPPGYQQPGMGGPPPGYQQPGMGGPPPGMGGQPGYQQPGMGPPPGMGGQPGYQQPGMGPQPGMGGQPGYQQPGMGGQPGYQQPGMGGQQPGMPYPGGGVPPYLASRSASRADAPFEPYNDGLRTCLIVFGVLLLAAFVVPMALEPKLGFRWDVLKGEGVPALVKFENIYLAAAGVLALVFGLVPLATIPRGALAAVLGVIPLGIGLVQHFQGPKVQWQVLAAVAGSITLVPGLLLRQEYRGAMLGRLLTTVGVLCLLLPLVVPDHGVIPLKAVFTAIGDAPGKQKVLAILKLLPLILALLSLLVWMPAPSAAGAKVIAWLFIVQSAIVGYVALVIQGHLGDVIKVNLNNSLLSGWVVAAWLALLGYGLATVFGKSLEQQR